MAHGPKTRLFDNSSTISADFLQTIFGGDNTAPPGDPALYGHLHDGRNDEWGHAPRVDLTAHTTGTLTLQDAYAVARSVSAYPSIVATPNNVISGTFLNYTGTTLNSKIALTIPATNPYNSSQADDVLINNVSTPVSGVLGTISGNAPTATGSNINSTLAGNVSIGLNDVFDSAGVATPMSPITTAGTVTSAVWYFNLPLDMDTTKPSYFTFNWMGDIITTDSNGNTILDASKMLNGSPAAQSTTFRVTWQWYSPGYAVFAPAVIYDGYTPANIVGTNINTNAATRGRISNMTVNTTPFNMCVNDSSVNNPTYVNLLGLQQTTNAVMLGVQVDVLNSGFVNNILGSQSGHIRFYQGNFVYMSKTLGTYGMSFKAF